AFMEDVKSRGPFIYSVLESAQAFLAQHPFQEPEETLADGKGLLPPYYMPTAAPAKMSHSFSPSEFI
ncbi:Dystrophin- protein 2, partial [Goodea atripinnis]